MQAHLFFTAFLVAFLTLASLAGILRPCQNSYGTLVTQPVYDNYPGYGTD
jgi:hypothetical protein